jgi:hypothetical protein
MFHLAQVNIARARFPLDDPRMHGFVSRLSEINEIAAASPGFVWRFTGDEFASPDYATRFDRSHVFNMSVWGTLEALKNFTYGSRHKDLFRDRHEWFDRMSVPTLAMWWIEAVSTPTVEEALVRLDHIREFGETAFSFTFRNVFPAPEEAAARAQEA